MYKYIYMKGAMSNEQCVHAQSSLSYSRFSMLNIIKCVGFEQIYVCTQLHIVS